MLSTNPKKSIYLDTFSLFAKFFNLSISSPFPIIVYLIFGIFSIKSANAEITVCIPLYCSCLSNLVTESILNLFSLKLFFRFSSRFNSKTRILHKKETAK